MGIYYPPDLFGVTPYPVNPLAALLRAAYAAKQSKEAQRQRDEEQAHLRTLRESQAREAQLGPVRDRYNILLGEINRFLTAGQAVPQDLLRQYEEVRGQLLGGSGQPVAPAPAGAPQQSAIQVAPADMARIATGQGSPSGTFGTIVQSTQPLPRPPIEGQTPQSPYFPQPQGPAFRTLGELASAFGAKIRGTNPDLAGMSLAAIRGQGVDPTSLLIFPDAEKNTKAQEALRRIEGLRRDYSLQQILADPQLRQAYMADYELAYGQPMPGKDVPELRMETRPAVPITGTGPGLSQAGLPQQAQVRTGQMVREPIMPQTGPQIVIDVPGVGKLPLSQLPEGAQGAAINRLFEESAKVEITLKDGQKVRVSPEKALDFISKNEAKGTLSIRLSNGVTLTGLTTEQYLSAHRANLEAQHAAQSNVPKPEKLTPAQRDAIWQRSYTQAAAEVLGKRASGMTISTGPDGEPTITVGANQAPLTAQEVTAIQARAQQIFDERVARAVGSAPVATAPKPAGPKPAPKGTVPIDARAYKGKTVRAPNGKRYRSDGVNWYEVP